MATRQHSRARWHWPKHETTCATNGAGAYTPHLRRQRLVHQGQRRAQLRVRRFLLLQAALRPGQLAAQGLQLSLLHLLRRG